MVASSYPYFVPGIYLLTRVIISQISHQNILQNILLSCPQQLALGLFIYRAVVNAILKRYQWKGRTINNLGFYLLIFHYSYTGMISNRVYNAYIRNDMAAWKTIIDRMQNQEKKSNEYLLSLVNYQYGYIGWCIGNEKEKEAETYISLARYNLAVLEKIIITCPWSYTYNAALYGYEIGLSLIRAPFIGPKSMKYAEHALKLDPGNLFCLYADGKYTVLYAFHVWWFCRGGYPAIF